MKVRMRLTREWLMASRVRVAANAFLGLRRIRHRLPRAENENGRSSGRTGCRAPLLAKASGQSSSVLAVRTVKGRAAALDDPPDRSAAAARLAFALVDREALREIAEFAIGRGEIPQGRPAGRDRFGEHLVDRRDQPFEPIERDRPPARLGWMPARNSASQT